MRDRFHPFGDDFPPERAGQADHSLQNGQIVRIVEHVPDKTLVDLELIDGQAFQVGQGRVSGTKIIEREMHAERPAILNDRRYAGQVLQRAGFQHLKCQIS